ncbi:transcription elongation factor A N-terminal and central domain-containing protein [Boleophthalmus pectinirostris]|uniref:transcription elongation factor A N-terminal and central domain-containing protein n=1 Tax=Boleophthalmus pectinirostris TaxID=150288 RepID=UPI000A1C4BB8|nr:transcription elongation factor A N-terminal and central domain-containing protein [Boleophthalmus pectinirostris]XP_055021642.1 transcription elongation factor A N-terminal and central domain-containing protein [Boleophthalmus pectinirostris]XP_055021646.1 transcription elongation factor A N-terminal and central domain-containing protein [Boleophthalmus pectinirostris]XP_055021651.1 transcription elongation factor A N-terminal and central domain-containing protein [Boleophthalmus pectinirost
MEIKDVLQCVLQIDKFNAERNYSDMLVLLGDLDKHHVSAEQLETTDIVKVLYRILKSCKNSDVKKNLKTILAKWKKGYSKEKDVKLEHAGKTDLALKSEIKPTLEQNEDKSKTENVILSSNLSPVRSKCVQLLLSAICTQSSDHDKALKLTEDIENHIYELHKSNIPKYKNCVRSKISNLKNPKSGHLREGLLNGSLSPQVFAVMSTEEMASPDLKQLRQEYSSQSVNERQLPQSIEGTPTQKIRCKRCDSMDCRVTQVSRGALFLPAWVKQSGPDDDSMTFVICSACGQQWYHNSWVCL